MGWVVLFEQMSFEFVLEQTDRRSVAQAVEEQSLGAFMIREQSLFSVRVKFPSVQVTPQPTCLLLHVHRAVQDYPACCTARARIRILQSRILSIFLLLLFRMVLKVPLFD